MELEDLTSRNEQWIITKLGTIIDNNRTLHTILCKT